MSIVFIFALSNKKPNKSNKNNNKSLLLKLKKKTAELSKTLTRKPFDTQILSLRNQYFKRIENWYKYKILLLK